jgi:CRISPR-associated endonuclease Csy4
MMPHYIELTIIPNEEIPFDFMWTKLYTQLHIALVDLHRHTGVALGIALPQYRYESGQGGVLGSKLRVFAANEALLQQLDLPKWLARLQDYVHLTGVREVPQGKITSYARYSRQHLRGNLEKYARRMAKRQGVSFEVALQKQCEQYAAKHQIELKQVDAHFHQSQSNAQLLPFVQLQSASTQDEAKNPRHTFRLLIRKTVATAEQAKAGAGVFNAYGLSSGAGGFLPEF